jgi:hypothetical protein
LPSFAVAWPSRDGDQEVSTLQKENGVLLDCTPFAN